MQHTPTPWTDNTSAKVEAGTRAGICQLDYYALSEENWQRAKTCVNACKPFKDPLESIPKLLVEVEALRDRVKELEERFAPFLAGDEYKNK